MLAKLIIEKKRDGHALTREEIEFFIRGFVSGEISDCQMSALAMAIFFRGLGREETAWLTEAMMRSGELLDLSALDLPKIDKHSSGGIGDKVSLVLAPLVACFGVAVPMISGRGLGITGGTLDKLEAIPGFRADLTNQEIITVVKKCGCCISGQTDSLVPADKKMYALRDVTATVSSIPLIVASIMSKKLAEGVDGLVLDVKVGRGAFMKSDEEARELAGQMVSVGEQMGKRLSAFITAMDQPLGRTVGNALEVKEALEALRGNGPPDLKEVVLRLGSEMLRLAGENRPLAELRLMLEGGLASGKAVERFKQMVALQGGEAQVLDDVSRLPMAGCIREFVAPRGGYVAKVDAKEIGRACLLLGGGRAAADDVIDYGVGFDRLVKVGELVSAGDTLARVHAKTEEDVERIRPLVAGAIEISDKPPLMQSLIREEFRAVT